MLAPDREKIVRATHNHCHHLILIFLIYLFHRDNNMSHDYLLFGYFFLCFLIIIFKLITFYSLNWSGLHILFKPLDLHVPGYQFCNVTYLLIILTGKVWVIMTHIVTKLFSMNSFICCLMDTLLCLIKVACARG